MEDASFYLEIPEGIIAGVFDGHRGAQVSKYANNRMPTEFQKQLLAHRGHFRNAMHEAVKIVQSEIAAKPEWNSQGSTMVFVFIDKHTHLAYTATLADAEANAYRNIKKANGQALTSFPLSCIRNWCSKKDEDRAFKEYPLLNNLWKNKKAKKRYNTANVSRALGDVHDTIISQKPKITIQRLEKGDLVILSCDGLKDFVAEREIVDALSINPNNPAEALAKLSVLNQRKKKEGGDNVSVIAIRIQ